MQATDEKTFEVPEELAEFYVEPAGEDIAEALGIAKKYGGAWGGLQPRPDLSLDWAGAQTYLRERALTQARRSKASRDEYDAYERRMTYECRVCGTRTRPGTVDLDGIPADRRYRGYGRRHVVAAVCNSCADDLTLRAAMRRVADPKYAKVLDAILDSIIESS